MPGWCPHCEHGEEEHHLGDGQRRPCTRGRTRCHSCTTAFRQAQQERQREIVSAQLAGERSPRPLTRAAWREAL